MKIILDNPTYNFKAPKFNSDCIISENILEPWPKSPFFLIIIGKPQSGKTSLLLNLCCNKKQNIYYKKFDKITLVMPGASQNNTKDNPFTKLPDEQKFVGWNSEIYHMIKNNYEDNKDKKNWHQLLICDDITASLKNKSVEKEYNDLVFNRRQYHCSIILSVQYLTSIPLSIRCCISQCVFFKCANGKELHKLRDEYTNLDTDELKELVKIVFTNKHDFYL